MNHNCRLSPLASRVMKLVEQRELLKKLFSKEFTIDERVTNTTDKEFFDKITGKGSFRFLEERVKSPLWKQRWENSERTQERSYTKVDSFTEEAQTAAKVWVPKIKEDILTYGKSEGLLPQDFDITILLLLYV